MAPTDAPKTTVRLFFALWPDDGVRAALASLTARLRSDCGGRAMAASNLHATLAFLGNVPQERVVEFTDVADSLTGDPFDLNLDALGYWRHNRIVWAGTRTMPAALAGLAAGMKAAIQRLRWPVDERPYTAHVTLLRDARHGPATHEAAIPLWRVSDFALVASTQQPGGVQYTPLQCWKLRG
ncbi:MAG: RNA 2',3'-cyclic phosphodiesterase [Rhodospirillaceae bacterium]